MRKTSPNFIAVNHGSLILVTPIGRDARQWIHDNVQADAQYHGRALVVEPRYFDDLAAGIVEAGFSIAVN